MAVYESQKLLDERASLHTQILDVAGQLRTAAEKNEGVSELRSSYDTMEARFTELTGDIKRLQNAEGYVAERSTPPVQEEEPRGVETEVRSSVNPTDTDQYRSAFDSYLRGGLSHMSPEERATMTVGVVDDGGYTVPRDLQRELILKLNEASGVR